MKNKKKNSCSFLSILNYNYTSTVYLKIDDEIFLNIFLFKIIFLKKEYSLSIVVGTFLFFSFSYLTHNLNLDIESDM